MAADGTEKAAVGDVWYWVCVEVCEAWTSSSLLLLSNVARRSVFFFLVGKNPCVSVTKQSAKMTTRRDRRVIMVGWYVRYALERFRLLVRVFQSRLAKTVSTYSARWCYPILYYETRELWTDAVQHRSCAIERSLIRNLPVTKKYDVWGYKFNEVAVSITKKEERIWSCGCPAELFPSLARP